MKSPLFPGEITIFRWFPADFQVIPGPRAQRPGRPGPPRRRMRRAAALGAARRGAAQPGSERHTWEVGR